MSNSQNDMEEKLSHQWATLEHISQWIQFADNKAGILIGVVSIIVGFLFSGTLELAKAKQTTPNFSYDWILTSTLLGAVVFLSWSCVCAFLCLYARTGRTKAFKSIVDDEIERPLNTTIFFGRIAGYSRKNYVSKVENLQLNQILEDLAGQSHVLSIIAEAKYRWLNRAYLSTGLSLLMFLLLGALSIFR